ncbi:hypothetical protein [Streptomyces sp. F001]|uniref:hypothetical protein n=1 Tax=Streptomyces sp. F001 TaxID=1510026 RepID=UPI0013EE76C2|nr:hypothetical protein [Streptomyces sp. F001]
MTTEPRPCPSPPQRLREHLVQAGAFLDMLRAVAQLAAAGHGYRRLARSLHTSPERVHAMAEAGARLLLREGTAPEELRDALAALPPLEPPPQRRPRPRRPPRQRTPPAALADLPLVDLDAVTLTVDLEHDLAVPLEDLEAIAAAAADEDDADPYEP